MIKKFTAPTVKEAIQLAKEHFGDDAIILQTKKSEQESGEPDMFELTAMSENNSPSVPESPAGRVSFEANRRRQAARSQPWPFTRFHE